MWLINGQQAPDSEVPVVCATTDMLTAMFMAVIPPNRLGVGYMPSQDGRVNFWIHHSRLEEVLHNLGYVASLGPVGFELHDGSYPQGREPSLLPRLPEWRRTRPVLATYILQVNGANFLHRALASPDHHLRVT